MLSPLLLLTKTARFFSKKLRREFDVNRWNCPVWRAAKPLSPTELNAESRKIRVLFLGTGFGEMRIVEQLSRALEGTHPHLEITWATRDHEAANSACRNFPGQRVSFMPFDFVLPTLNFLRHNRPDIVVFVEKFWFPNLAGACAAWGAKSVVVNARTRSHEGLRYRLMAPYHRWILSRFTRMCFQSDEDWRRVRRLLPSQVEAKVVGNLKFEVDPSATKADESSLRAWLKTRSSKTEIPLLAAGSSTDEEEDRFVLDAFEIVRRATPCALLLAPRRVQRAPDLIREITRRGLTVSRRSAFLDGDETESAADVYLLDTMGELAAAYQFSWAAYVGGTLNSAGHNMAEPLHWGIPVSYGPSRGFFESVQKACEKAGVGFRVRTPKELATHWDEVLADATKRELWRRDAQRLLDEQRGALERNVDQIRAIIDSVTPPNSSQS